MLSKGISVVSVVKNGLINGYPFWESLTSCVPIADEIIINEGFSTDKTYETLIKFQKKYGSKVKIFRTDWSKYTTQEGEIISKVSQSAISKCSKEWVYYLQADEVIHPDNVNVIRNIASGAMGNYNAIWFNYYHFIGSWKPLPPGGAAYSQAIRMVKNHPSIFLIGDAWNFGGNVHPSFGPSGIPKPVFHFAWVFPKNIDLKNIEQSKIYPKLQGYQDKAKVSKQRVLSGYSGYTGFPKPDDFNDYPCGMDRLVGSFEYSLPDIG